LKKLDEIAETLRSGEMPLSSYTVIHHNAKLSSADKSEIEKWVVQVKKDQLIIKSSILFCYDKNIQ
jgi:hypothetical protein